MNSLAELCFQCHMACKTELETMKKMSIVANVTLFCVFTVLVRQLIHIEGFYIYDKAW